MNPYYVQRFAYLEEREDLLQQLDQINALRQYNSDLLDIRGELEKFRRQRKLRYYPFSTSHRTNYGEWDRVEWQLERDLKSLDGKYWFVTQVKSTLLVLETLRDGGYVWSWSSKDYINRTDLHGKSGNRFNGNFDDEWRHVFIYKAVEPQFDKKHKEKRTATLTEVGEWLIAHPDRVTEWLQNHHDHANTINRLMGITTGGSHD